MSGQPKSVSFETTVAASGNNTCSAPESNGEPAEGK
jgi:hypothetical protein